MGSTWDWSQPVLSENVEIEQRRDLAGKGGEFVEGGAFVAGPAVGIEPAVDDQRIAGGEFGRWLRKATKPQADVGEPPAVDMQGKQKGDAVGRGEALGQDMNRAHQVSSGSVGNAAQPEFEIDQVGNRRPSVRGHGAALTKIIDHRGQVFAVGEIAEP